MAGMMILMLLNRMHVKLDRDVIFLAEAGEEGSSSLGIEYMVKEHWPEIEAEYALAEGGGIVEEKGKVFDVLIATTEKVPRRIRLKARGPAGHGSRPIPQNALVHLAQAVARAGTWQTPIRLNETTRAYFERLAAVAAPEQAARYRAILHPARAAAIDRYFYNNEPGHYSILRTSISPTIINGGFRQNVIPSEGEAMLDIRALPDEDMARFTAELRRVINDDAVEIIPAPEGRPAAPPSRIDSDDVSCHRKGKPPDVPGAYDPQHDDRCDRYGAASRQRRTGLWSRGASRRGRWPAGRRSFRRRAHLRPCPDDPDRVSLEHRPGDRLVFRSLTSVH